MKQTGFRHRRLSLRADRAGPAPGRAPGSAASGLERDRHRGQPGHEHLEHEVVGPGLAAAEVEVGLGQQVDHADDPVMAQLAGLAERLAGRERRALQPEQLGRLLLPRHLRAVERAASARSGECSVASTWNGCRSPWPIIRWSSSRASGAVAPVDGVGEVPRGDAAVVAEERLDLGHPQLGRRCRRSSGAGRSARAAGRLVAQPGDQALAGLGVDLEAASARCCCTHSATLRPGLVSTCSPPARRRPPRRSALGTFPVRHSRTRRVLGSGSAR